MVERQNRTLEQILKTLMNQHQGEWDYLLPYALFAYRTSIQESIRTTPFQMTFGRAPSLPEELILRGTPVDAFTAMSHQRNASTNFRTLYAQVEQSLKAAREKQKKYFDQ